MHVSKENIVWFSENEIEILNEISRVLCDHISLIQHCYQQFCESSGHASTNLNTLYQQEDLHHMQGDTISISYGIRKNSKQYDNTLQYKSTEVNSIPETMSMSSFSLNPLYVSPLQTTPVLSIESMPINASS